MPQSYRLEGSPVFESLGNFSFDLLKFGQKRIAFLGAPPGAHGGLRAAQIRLHGRLLLDDRPRAHRLRHRPGVLCPREAGPRAETRSRGSGGNIMNTSPTHEIYIPGYVPQKILMILFGVILIGLSSLDLVPNLQLLFFGTPATAKTVRILKVKAGLPDEVFLDDVLVRENFERMDRSYLFWNVFAFQTADGTRVKLRMPTAGLLKPLYPLKEADGLSTTLPIRYDPADPRRVIFPTVFSTWIFPTLLVLIGLLAAGSGSVLLFYARRPIEMPIVPPEKTAPSS